MAKYNEAALTEILGPYSYNILHTDEPARDREVAQAFAAKAREKKRIAIAKNNPRRAILEIGDEDWPFAVPIVKTGAMWSFDSKAGRQELLYRRIGGNELDAIQICRGYVEAQHDFALMKRTNGVNQYAQRIISTSEVVPKARSLGFRIINEARESHLRTLRLQRRQRAISLAAVDTS